MTKKIFRCFLLMSMSFILIGNMSIPVHAELDNWADLGEIIPGQNGATLLSTSPSGHIFGGTTGPSGVPYLFDFDTIAPQSAPLIQVPGSGAEVGRIATAPDGRVYIATSKTYGQGNLAGYNPATKNVTDLGSIGDEYAQGLVVGSDNNVYIATCCQGKLSIYNPSTNSWNYRGRIINNQVRLSGLAAGPDGYIYGVTSRIWITPYGDASLFRYNPSNQTTTVIGTIYAGVHESWAISYNPVDGKIYMAVGYNMPSRLFAYDPVIPAQGIQDLGAVATGSDSVSAGGIAISPDGKVYVFALPVNHMVVYDPLNPGAGVVDLGVSTGGSPLVFGADHKLYGMSGTHLRRSNQINPEASYSIIGTVTDDNGQPASGVQISTDYGTSTLTDLNGQYRLVGVEAGEYIITPKKDEFRFAPVEVKLTVDKNLTRNFIIRPQKPDRFLDLPLRYTDVFGFSEQERFALASSGSERGSGPGYVNSWFDHELPRYNQPNGKLTRWDGFVFEPKDMIGVGNCATAPGGLGKTCYDYHNGIDFRHTLLINDPQPVYAAGNGVVVVSPKITGYGNSILINHHNGYATFYGHLASVSVSIGNTVAAGVTQIGVMGNTGTGSAGVHLHFGVYYDINGDHDWDESEVVDPYGWRPWVVSDIDPWKVNSFYLWKYENEIQSTLTSSGGSFAGASGLLMCTIPPDSVMSNYTLEIMDTPTTIDASAQLRSVGLNFQTKLIPDVSILSSPNIQNTSSGEFNIPVELKVSYIPSSLNHLDLNLLSLYHWDEISLTWSKLPSTLNQLNHTVSAQTTDTGLFSLQTSLICPNDTSEPNDSYAAAGTIVVDSTQSLGVLDIQGDEDWYTFDLVGGKTYYIRVLGDTALVNPSVKLFTLGGTTMLQSFTTENGLGVIRWTAPIDGSYSLLISKSGQSNVGCQSGYNVNVSSEKQVFLPVLTR